MRRGLAYLLLVLPLLAACSRGEDPYVIGVSQCSVDAWREAANNEILQEASFYGDVTVSIRSVHDDSEQQIEDIEKFIDEKVDLLVISPNESTSLTPVVEKAYRSGIPVILYDRKIDSDQYTAFIGGDNRQIGYAAGSYAMSTLRNSGRICIIRGTKGATADTERYEGFVSSLEENPDFGGSVVAEEYANFNRQSAENAMRSLLASGEGPFDLVFAFNDEMAAGVFDAYASSDIPDKPYILGIDALLTPNGTGTISYIQNGMINASFIYPTGGKDVVDLARRILKGEEYQKENVLNTEVVNSSNVRVYQMQINQVLDRQRRVEELNSRIRTNTSKYERQQILTLFSFSLVAILALLSIALSYSYRTRNKLVEMLNEQNTRIKKQIESLEDQKRQLLDLSRQLEETTQAKLVFFTNISHEFKTPLSLISGPINDLLATEGMPESAQVPLDILKRNSSKLERLITELLDFRTYENSKMVVNYSMGDMDKFLQEILKMFSDVIRRRNLKFSYEADDAGYEIPFDPIKLEKVFTNLLSNAFNHVDKEGTIRIRLFSTWSGDDRTVNLSVFNSGSYIPPENMEKIFQRFYTLDAQQKGTGIGLALVTSIVDALGGSIKVDSKEGVGTAFTLQLPVEKGLRTDARIDKSYVPEFARLKLATMGEEDVDSGILDEMSPTDKKKSVLVIEDNMDMRHYIKNILSAEYHVIMAKDGTVGLSKAQRFLPDIILCDIMMPGLDGYEVCSALRNAPATRNIPIILLTACSLDEQKAQGYESGADAFMQKPFNVTTLKVRMRKLLEKSESITAEIQGDWLVGRDAGTMSSESAGMLNKFREYVESHILDDISLDDLAGALGYSKSKLYRELKEVTEYTPIDLVNLVRLHKAVDLMTTEHQNITEAAFNSGFSSPSYFSRTFLKYYHMRPKDYLKGK
jgi:signal transduction histidine kinase/CheY-like chemotaxis protein/AraC-like DNA-binding protein